MDLSVPGLKISEIFGILPVAFCRLVFSHVGIVSLFSRRSLLLKRLLVLRRKVLPALSDTLCYISKRQILWF